MSVRRALVTGAGGFVGRWLCRELASAGWLVTATTLGDAPRSAESGVEWRHEDLADGRAAADAVDAARPDAVFHLAGMAFVLEAGRDPDRALRVNVGSAVRLLAALQERRAAGVVDPAVVVVGSAEQYGRREPDSMPLLETDECRPRSMYAATKQAQEVFALEAFRAGGLRVIATRSFNHSGVGQSPKFLLPALVGRVRAMQAAGGEEIAIGNTETVRDFLHVHDVVRAYIALAERGVAGEIYNVCSGDGVRIGTLVEEVCRLAGVAPRLVPDPALQRPADIPASVGSNAKLRAHTGWVPARARADIITDLLNASSH